MNSYKVIASPVGDLTLIANEEELTGVYFEDPDDNPGARATWKFDEQHLVLRMAEEQLHAYFAGQRTSFLLPLRFSGTTFQERVWREIALIPYGTTITYSELAKRAQAPAAIRAAGSSTGRNPISIIVPCHRVMGKNGSITGYAGGLDRKRFLLELEHRGARQQTLL